MRRGLQIKGYRIERLLGRGGMGEVYEATQLRLSRRVAFKVVYSELSHDEAFVERFEREGRLQAALDHPHVVTVYEAGELDNGLFLAMRLVDSPNLKELISKRGLEGARALRLLRPVAAALDAAHAVGVVHRDVKPQNILIAAGDYPYLADFGLVRAERGQRAHAQRASSSGRFTTPRPSRSIGEPSRRARRRSTRSPPCSTSRLTRSVPFPRGLEAAVLYAQVSDAPPSVTALRDDLPAEIDEVIAGRNGQEAQRQARERGRARRAGRLGPRGAAASPPARVRRRDHGGRAAAAGDESPRRRRSRAGAATPTTVPTLRRRRARVAPALAVAATRARRRGRLRRRPSGDDEEPTGRSYRSRRRTAWSP